MKNLGRELSKTVSTLSGESGNARKMLRAKQVQNRFKEAMEAVYKDTAPLFLEHVNAVYILKKDGKRLMIVYVDESIYAAELNARRELIKFTMLEMFGEELDEFRISVSRGSYKKRHPYVRSEAEKEPEKEPVRALSESEKKTIEETAAKIENPRLRKMLEKAMTAEFQWKN